MKIRNKFLLFLLCALLLLPVMTVGISATDDVTYVQWELSEDELMLTDGNKTYTAFESAVHFYFDPAHIYEYVNPVYLSEDGYYSDGESYVFAPNPDSEFVWIEGKQYSYIYTTKTGEKDLILFLNGENASYRLEDAEGKQAALGSAVIESLFDRRSTWSTKEFYVKDLEKVVRYDITAHDTTRTLAYVRGAVYQMNDVYYVVDYHTLGNQYFDADGNFSYRSGTVELKQVPEEFALQLDSAKEKTAYGEVNFSYENESEMDEGSMIVFWILFVILGFVAPIPFLILGLVLPQSKKRGYAKYWYVLAALAALWIILSIILIFVLIL